MKWRPRAAWITLVENGQLKSHRNGDNFEQQGFHFHLKLRAGSHGSFLKPWNISNIEKYRKQYNSQAFTPRATASSGLRVKWKRLAFFQQKHLAQEARLAACAWAGPWLRSTPTPGRGNHRWNETEGRMLLCLFQNLFLVPRPKNYGLSWITVFITLSLSGPHSWPLFSDLLSIIPIK